MGKLVSSVAGLAAILCGAARWLVLLPWAGVRSPGHPGRGLEDGWLVLGQLVRQENLGGMLGGSGLVCLGVLLTLRVLGSSRGGVRRRAKRGALLFWGLAGGSTVTIHALIVMIHLLRP